MEHTHQTNRFLLLYALAVAGGAIAYVPFLTILLPMRVADLSGSENVEWLAYITFAGAVSASISNILFGWLSDITRNRKYWVVSGLILSCLLLLSIIAATSFSQLITLVILWQIGLNMMLSPLGAWAGDSVPDGQKGLLGGLLSFAPALGALSATLITVPGLADADTRLMIIAGLVSACILPAILFGTPRQFAELQQKDPTDNADTEPRGVTRSIVLRMWGARLLIQISEAALFAYLYYWFRSVAEGMTDSSVAQLFSIILVGSIPAALIAGRWADKTGRPIIPLPITAALAGVGLIAMALSTALSTAIAGYMLFGITSAVFLALHTSQTLRVLPDPATRGRDLGIFNLTNTGPSLIVPWLTLALVPLFGFSGLFFLLAALAFAASILLFSIPDR